MWHQMPLGGFKPAQRFRKHLLDWAMYSGKTPSRTIRRSWYMSSMNMFRARIRCFSPSSMNRHSWHSMIRGMRSKGQIFSVPASWP